MSLVAIVGRPNVGKSTLFNRLVGQRKAIVDATAGTTRDRHYGKTDWNGREFSVIDTGGYSVNSDDIFEDDIRRQVMLAIEEADVILFLVEVNTGITDLDQMMADILIYTEEGNWDLVGNNTPVFFLRDPLKFPDLNHAIKRDPRTNMRSARNNWDFWTSLPEAFHQVTVVMSDRGIPSSYRHMHGFGSHAFSMLNADNERVWVKFHLKTQQGIKNLTDAEAEAIIAKDRESHQRDFGDNIDRPVRTSGSVSLQEAIKDGIPASFRDIGHTFTGSWPAP